MAILIVMSIVLSLTQQYKYRKYNSHHEIYLKIIDSQRVTKPKTAILIPVFVIQAIQS
jgi:hypothetical protein